MATIRRVKPEDMVDIVKIEFTCFKYPYSPSMLLWFYEACRDGFFIAEERGKVAGYCICDPSQDEIISIAVLPGLRQKGIGSGLLAKAQGYLKSQGIRKAKVHVRKGNREAIDFYGAQGFQEARTIKNYYGNEDGILMEKDLGKKD